MPKSKQGMTMHSLVAAHFLRLDGVYIYICTWVQ
jgi:hypothetical protein